MMFAGNGYLKLWFLQSLRVSLFQLFEQHDKIWVQDLKGLLDGPEDAVKALLRDYCTKEKVGARTFYSLNRDFRASS